MWQVFLQEVFRQTLEQWLLRALAGHKARAHTHLHIIHLNAIRYICVYTLWLFNIAMENGPFIDDFPIKTSIYEGFSMAMLNNQMEYIYNYIYNYIHHHPVMLGKIECRIFKQCPVLVRFLFLQCPYSTYSRMTTRRINIYLFVHVAHVGMHML